MELKRVITGHLNELLNINKDLGTERMEICKRCPLLKITEEWGPICNSELYLNVQTNETSETPKENFKKGCGCRLNAKTRDKESHCPLKKW